MFELRDRDRIERHLRRNPALHLYELGDLDPFFWPHTRWWGLPGAGDELGAVALLYSGCSLPTLLLLSDAREAAAALLAALEPELPARTYAHLSPGLAGGLRSWEATPHGLHHKMTLIHPERLVGHDDPRVERLGPGNLAEVEAFYARCYPGNWFAPRMLETEHYVGLRDEGALRCVAGVHVYSPAYGVAALGNIATDPAWRGRGLARRATAQLCRLLRESVSTIGLNVKQDNAAAQACYRRLGFAHTADHDEVLLTRIG